MIIEYIRYELTTHTPEALIEAYGRASISLREAPECLGYELSQRKDASNLFVLRIHWKSAEAHMEGFRKGLNFPPFVEIVRPFIGEIAEMKHYHHTDIMWRREA